MALLVFSLTAAHAAASDVRPASTVDIDSAPGTLAIICPTGIEGERFVSRGFAIAGQSSARFDIVLAARHGSGDVRDGDFSDCQVRAAGGEYVEISASRQSAVYRDEGDDWIILRTAGPLPSSILRYGLARARSGADDLPDVAVLSSGLGADCHVRDEDVHSGQGRLFAHDCDTRPGISGSPIVVLLDGELTAIGIHIGRRLEFSAGEQQVLGVGRWIDTAIEQAVMDLAYAAD